MRSCSARDADAAASICELVAERSADELGGDPIRRAALLWHFTVLGEAASQMPDELRAVLGSIE